MVQHLEAALLRGAQLSDRLVLIGGSLAWVCVWVGGWGLFKAASLCCSWNTTERRGFSLALAFIYDTNTQRGLLLSVS